MNQTEERSYKVIRKEDLEKLSIIAQREREKFFDRNPPLKLAYHDSLVAIALCQGAALHFIDRTTGIKDFDIWYFYIKHHRVKYPWRALKHVDSGLDRFGIHPADHERGYKGRGMDLIGRAICGKRAEARREPCNFIVRYLETGGTKTVRELGKKAVIGLWPHTILGEIVWRGPIHAH